MSDSVSSAHSSGSEFEDEASVQLTIEVAHLRSILQSFSEIADHTYFIFSEDEFIMFPQDSPTGETVDKKGKKRADSGTKRVDNPNLFVQFNTENIFYSHTIPGERIFISFPTKTIISNIKSYGKKESLLLRIDEEEPNIIHCTGTVSSNSVNSVVSMSGKSVDEGIYQPVDPLSFEDPSLKYVYKENDFKKILAGIGTGTSRAPIDCSLKISKAGYMIEAKTEGGSQTHCLGNATPRDANIGELKWSRNTINALKKLQISDGACVLSYRENGPFTIDRKIANIANITYIFN